MQNEHLIESEFWEMHEHPSEGTLRMPKLPIYFSESPASIRLMPPELGAHNDELLNEIGYSEDEISKLKEKGITS
jgi:formyl-CoA transferase